MEFEEFSPGGDGEGAGGGGQYHAEASFLEDVHFFLEGVAEGLLQFQVVGDDSLVEGGLGGLGDGGDFVGVGVVGGDGFGRVHFSEEVGIVVLEFLDFREGDFVLFFLYDQFVLDGRLCHLGICGGVVPFPPS